MNSSEIRQCSNCAPRESIVCEVKYYFITLVVSNIMLFNKTILFFIFLCNNKNLIMVSLVRKKTRQIIHDRIRTDKICNTYCSIFLCLRILCDQIWSDKDHSLGPYTFLNPWILQGFCWHLTVRIWWNLLKNEHIRYCPILWQDHTKKLASVRSYLIVYDLTSVFSTCGHSRYIF